MYQVVDFPRCVKRNEMAHGVAIAQGCTTTAGGYMAKGRGWVVFAGFLGENLLEFGLHGSLGCASVDACDVELCSNHLVGTNGTAVKNHRRFGEGLTDNASASFY